MSITNALTPTMTGIRASDREHFIIKKTILYGSFYLLNCFCQAAKCSGENNLTQPPAYQRNCKNIDGYRVWCEISLKLMFPYICHGLVCVYFKVWNKHIGGNKHKFNLEENSMYGFK